MPETDSISRRDEEEARQLAQLVDRFINGHSTSKHCMDAFADEIVHRMHRTLQQSFMRYIWTLLRAWAKCKKEKCFDLRNEATVEFSEKIVRQFEGEAVFPFI